MTRAILSIKRPWSLANIARKYIVFVDDVKVGGVKSGREAKFEVTPGRHSVYIKFDFYKSKPCVIEFQPDESVTLICGVKEGMSGFISAFTSPKDYLYLKPAEDLVPPTVTTKSTSHPVPEGQVTVRMVSEEERVPAATEEVHVPAGVKIKVKRSHTVEHTVEVDWTIAGEVRLEAGLKQVVSGSIRGEISQKQGRSTTESETVEYEIELDGEKGRQYRLQWTDIWRKGTAELRHGGATHLLPFRYRERSELEVMPVAEGA